MATITVCNLPDQVMASLGDLASRQGISVEEQVRRLLAETTTDRVAACKLIEAGWKRQERTPSAKEVATWVRASRP